MLFGFRVILRLSCFAEGFCCACDKYNTMDTPVALFDFQGAHPWNACSRSNDGVKLVGFPQNEFGRLSKRNKRKNHSPFSTMQSLFQVEYFNANFNLSITCITKAPGRQLGDRPYPAVSMYPISIFHFELLLRDVDRLVSTASADCDNQFSRMPCNRQILRPSFFWLQPHGLTFTALMGHLTLLVDVWIYLVGTDVVGLWGYIGGDNN